MPSRESKILTPKSFLVRFAIISSKLTLALSGPPLLFSCECKYYLLSTTYYFIFDNYACFGDTL